MRDSVYSVASALKYKGIDGIANIVLALLCIGTIVFIPFGIVILLSWRQSLTVQEDGLLIQGITKSENFIF